MKDPMLDEDFLRELDHFKHKFLWAKIISLNFEEYPQQEIIGKVTSGSISVDGNSSVRRTCSLSLVANEVDINDFYWSLNTKFKVEIGLENWINPEYPKIIWFKQGTFLISTFNCSVGVNNYTINIQGKDKMVLLNGEVGGVVPASWDFGKIDVTNPDGSITQDFYPIKDIIYQAVHEYAQEPWQNIIVNDLDDYGIELLQYMGSTPLYYIIENEGSGDNDSREVYNMTCDDMTCWIKTNKTTGDPWVETKLSELEKISKTGDAIEPGAAASEHYWYEQLIDQLDSNEDVIDSNVYEPAIVKFGESPASPTYTVAKITSDNGFQVCGYRVCDIVYPYDLIASPGESLTSVLDKLVKMLGNFEYFYDVEGRFIFQKKKIYADVSYNNIINEHSISSEVWAESSAFSSKYSYSFGKSELLSSIQNNPNLSNLKNDFSLWGERDQGNIKVPIHMRYAIDHKPYWYKVIGHQIKRDSEGRAIGKNGELLQDFDDKGKLVTYSNEYVYDNAKKVYVSKEGWDEYLSRITEYEIETGDRLKTKEEIDALNIPDEEKEKIVRKYQETDEDVVFVDWREIIYQMANDYRRHYREEDFLIKVRKNNMITPYDSWYQKGYTGYEKYYIDFEMNLSQGVVAYWRELYNPAAAGQTGRYLPNGNFESDSPNDESNNGLSAWSPNSSYKKNQRVIYNDEIYRSTADNNKTTPGGLKSDWIISHGDFTYNSEGWNPDILNNPEALNFWFDFLDTTGELNKYTVSNIGQRSKATNDTTIKAIYFRETPNVIFYTSPEENMKLNNWRKPGYCYMHVPEGLDNLFSISSRGKNSMDVISEYLYTYTYPASAITLNSIPIYYLTPNTLIYVEDKDTGAIGEYIMQKYSIQLGLSAQMTINAVETPKRLY